MPQRTYLITGASKGIGRALAERLARDGHNVIGLARDASASNFPGTLVPVDLADHLSTQAVLERLTSEYAFDGVVNNVGLVRPQKLGAIAIGDLEAVLALTLHPAVQTAQALLPAMRKAGRGRIVNISSLTVLGMVERTAYAAAKAALISFSRSWALELATTGITVNAVAPGPTETELYAATNPPGSSSAARHLASVPMQRLGKPSEVASAVRFLASDSASFITGQTIFVDGGASI